MKEAAEAVMTELAVSSNILSRSILSKSPSQAMAMASRAASQPTTIPCTWGRWEKQYYYYYHYHYPD